MQGSRRFYIQSKFETAKFLRKFSFLQHEPINFVYSSTYQPNISEFPISFTSVDSIKDHVEIKMFDQLQNNHISEISYTFLNDIRNLKIVHLESFNGSASCYAADCENSIINNMEQYVRKSAFKWLSYKIFGTKITDHYFLQSKMDDRTLTQIPAFNNYLVELPEDIHHSAQNNFYQYSQNLTNLGINFSTDYQNQLFVFQDLDNLNLARIAIENAHKWRITKSEELYNLECRISYSTPIPLTPAHNQIYQ